jgi:hypothetical protein
MMPMRSELRIRDLKGRVPTASRLMNVKVPTALWESIDRLARKLGASRTQVVLALLNAGLEIAAEKRLSAGNRPRR